MTEQNTTPATETTPAAATDSTPATEAKEKRDTKHRQAFNSLAEASACKPDSDKLRVLQVTDPAGVVKFTWANDGNGAILQVARAAGYTAAVAGKAPSREKVATLLSQLSAEDRAILIASVTGGTPAPAANSTPATDSTPAPAPAGKGRKGK